MMRFALVAALISALQLGTCDLTGGSATVRMQTEVQLRQYFPRARALVLPERGTIVAMTCTQGLGKAAVEEIGNFLEKKRAIQRLQQARRLPLKLSPYRFFVLEFGEYRMRLDADTRQRQILTADPESRLRYKQICSNDLPTTTVNP